MTDGGELSEELGRVDDAFLVARARDGDLRAFTTLLQRYSGMLRRYVERITRNTADTDDVLQETAVIAWQRLGDVREPDRVRAWLVQIATRQALRSISERTADAPLDDETPAPTGMALDRLDLEQALQAVLDALPPQQSRCWVLRELGGYSYSEIATELGVPESTVRGALAAARRTIVRAMGDRR